MTFRARLTLFFVGIVVVPLAVSAIVVQRVARTQAVSRTDAEARVLAVEVRHRLDEQQELVERALCPSPRVCRQVASDAVAAGSRRALDRLRVDLGLDFLVVVGRGLRGSVADLGLVGPDPSPETLADPSATRGLASSYEIRIANRPGSRLVGGLVRDEAFLRELQSRLDVDLLTVWRGRIVASTIRPVPAVTPTATGAFPVGEGGRGLCVCSRGSPPSGVVVARAMVPAKGVADLPPLALGSIALGILLAGALAYVLARLLSRPLQRLTEEAVLAGGDEAGTGLAAARGDDVARLGAALHAMRARLGRTVEQLGESRQELRRGLERLGETLQATHDLDDLLAVVLEAAASTLGAEAGAVYLRTGEGDLSARARFGQPEPPAVLAAGEGIAGRVAASGAPVLFPAPDGPLPGSGEPARATALAVPVGRGGRPTGALALYGRTTGQPYTAEDLDALASFGEQMAVAVENVLVHEETERLSYMDALTGAWNRRHLEITLRQEAERGQRFGHPFSVLMLDVDQFKQVNDRFGHARGDSVLGELTRRVNSSIRAHIDVLARYGGEEFMIVLPETGRDGALVAAEKVRRLVAERPFEEGGEGITVTVSVGAASFPEDGRSPDALIRAADRALYEAKRTGRNRVVAHVR